jgi:hypothetical protein
VNDRVNDYSRLYSVLTEMTVDPPTSTVHRLSVIVLMADVIEGKQTLELTHWSSLKSSNFQGSKASGTGGGLLEHKITRVL